MISTWISTLSLDPNRTRARQTRCWPDQCAMARHRDSGGRELRSRRDGARCGETESLSLCSGRGAHTINHYGTAVQHVPYQCDIHIQCPRERGPPRTLLLFEFRSRRGLRSETHDMIHDATHVRALGQGGAARRGRATKSMTKSTRQRCWLRSCAVATR